MNELMRAMGFYLKIIVGIAALIGAVWALRNPSGWLILAMAAFVAWAISTTVLLVMILRRLSSPDKHI